MQQAYQLYHDGYNVVEILLTLYIGGYVRSYFNILYQKENTQFLRIRSELNI